MPHRNKSSFEEAYANGVAAFFAGEYVKAEEPLTWAIQAGTKCTIQEFSISGAWSTKEPVGPEGKPKPISGSQRLEHDGFPGVVSAWINRWSGFWGLCIDVGEKFRHPK